MNHPFKTKSVGTRAAAKPSAAKGATNDPATNDKFTDVKKFGGEPGKRYKVTIRVRVVVEAK